MKRLACLLLVAMLATGCNTINNRTERACVTEKGPVVTETGNEYRVYTDQGTYKVTDILVGPTRFNSADVYAGLQPGACYDFELVGIRAGIVSQFPNIVSYTEVSQ